MKLSHILYKEHVGRMVRSLWYIQGKKKLIETNVEDILKLNNIKAIDAKTFLEHKPKRRIQTIVTSPKKPKSTSYLSYGDKDLLVEGVSQAQLITNTLVFENELPKSIELSLEDLSDDTNQLVKRIIKSSVIFDACQQLLPKIKDPDRPAFNFPRELGITDVRKISNLSKKLIQLCDCISGPEIANNRYLVDNVLCSYLFEKNLQPYKFSLTMDVVLMSKAPIKPIRSFEEINTSQTLPIIDPLHYSIGLKTEKSYQFKNSMLLNKTYNEKQVHTIFIFFDSANVKNLTELEIKEPQIFARAILKAFATAANIATQKYGPNIEKLPKPITIQCIHSDGKAFYFSVYQLNTLNFNESAKIKNFCWMLPRLDLYESSGYVDGIPTLNKYNPEVFRRILAFYKNN